MPIGSLIMMALGRYRFGIDRPSHQKLARNASYRHPSIPLVGTHPASQFTGPGDVKVQLSGVILPSFRGGLRQIDRMMADAERGTGLLMVDGMGWVGGRWVIEGISDQLAYFMRDGAPRKIDFRISLKRVER